MFDNHVNIVFCCALNMSYQPVLIMIVMVEKYQPSNEDIDSFINTGSLWGVNIQFIRHMYHNQYMTFPIKNDKH